jgi:GR25 family glycosyltransferase involved in LPS biosynthesis
MARYFSSSSVSERLRVQDEIKPQFHFTLPPIYVINLDERTDRMRRMDVCLKNRNLSYERFSAIRIDNRNDVCVELGNDKIWYGGDDKEPYYSGCTHSHLTILKKAYDSNVDGIIVMEDDVFCMNRDAKKLLEDAITHLPKDGEYLSLEYKLYDPNLLERYNNAYYRSRGGFYGTGCYYITRAGIKRALEAFLAQKDEKKYKAIDIFYISVFKDKGLYCVRNKLCYQGAIRNDIKDFNNTVRNIEIRGRIIPTINLQSLIHFRYRL